MKRDALGRRDAEVVLVHTGHHYERPISTVFLEDLGIRSPDRCLEVGSGNTRSSRCGMAGRGGGSPTSIWTRPGPPLGAVTPPAVRGALRPVADTVTVAPAQSQRAPHESKGSWSRPLIWSNRIKRLACRLRCHPDESL